MFKKIFNTWKREGLLHQALDATENMFLLASHNFDIATDELINNLDIKRADIYANDQKINANEKDVRRKVLEHLTLNPKQDTTHALILITVVKDLERIGDYIKNMVELAYSYPKKLPDDDYTKDLILIRDNLSIHLKNAVDIFKMGEKDKAQTFYVYYREVTKKTDALILHIMDDDKLKVREAVIYALFSRYLKRISAHLANILTTVINPFHLVGYGIKGDEDKEEID
ncbi:MAG: hypothetical protein MUP70_05165 [Candidatus Aminicenantes bacterium]|nr:hypothetical protein [Candidatus Aminicenantes bacterium]